MGKGILNVIYVLTNPQYPGYVKIGYASDLKARLASLNTGALTEFTPYAVYETERNRGDVDVQKLIELLNPVLRASKVCNGKIKLKEFYKIEPEDAYAMLLYIAKISGTTDRLYRVDENFQKIQCTLDIDANPSNAKESAGTQCEQEGTAAHAADNAKADDLVQGTLPDGIYHGTRWLKLEDRKIYAIMEIVNGACVVRAGSEIAKHDAETITERARSLRGKALVKNGVLKEDIPCPLSTTAEIIVGKSVNVWTFWKDSNERYISDYRVNPKDNTQTDVRPTHTTQHRKNHGSKHNDKHAATKCA